MNTYRILFMGTPGFAVPGLEALHASRHQVLAVVTQPDRPKGRGRKLTPPPVKTTAERLGIPVAQPTNINTPEALSYLKYHAPDLFVVIAYGRIFKAHHFAIPRFGIINVHASLLPRHRGPAPIQRAILESDRETGVTTMQMVEELDAGDILLQARTPVAPDDTAATLHDRLAGMGAALLVETLDRMAAGDLKPTPQDPSAATYAPLLKKEDGRIRWQQPSAAIDAFVRGMTPWPGAFTFLDAMRLKVFKVQSALLPEPAAPGTILPGFGHEIRVATGDGALSIMELQSESGRRMSTADFLKGNTIPPGAKLE